MPNPIETLKKIEFQDITQFLEDINRNFAVVENSPLYKGIPGIKGIGLNGLPGLRGSKFIFINLQKFQEQFPGELSSINQIDINYINTKLLTFTNKQKLLLALNITELIDKDVVVLYNTIMLSYNSVDEIFLNTGIAFNEQSNLLNNIQQQIEDYVQFYVNNNQTINNLSNTFESYVTYAKNYTDTNNVFITSSLINSSVYSPYIPGFNSNIGILMNNHKYFGYSNIEFPIDNDGTIVFGSMKKYYNLLMSTLSLSGTDTLTSDYAPGVGNIPSAVFLQDTENAGILIGYKGRQNLKRFANIYKNTLHELILKSDSGVNPSEFSELKLHKDYLKFSKLVQLGNDLEVSRDTKLFSDIQNNFLRTGKFSEGANISNNFNNNIIEIGKEKTLLNPEETITINVSDIEKYKHYIENVLITDINGIVSKAYSLETTPINNSNISDLGLIDALTINSPNKILTSYYFGFLARKINAISNFCNTNYWRKNQFNTGEIPDLWLSNNLKVDRDVNLTNGQIITNRLQGKTFLNANELKISSKKINLSNFPNNVLVTDETGYILTDYYVENQNFPVNELNQGEMLSYLGESNVSILTTKYYGHLARKINQVYSDLYGNYWRKNQYDTFDIPNLSLSNDLIVKGNVIFKPNNIEVFKVDKLTNDVTIGSAATKTILSSNIIKLIQFVDKVLVTDNNGELLNQYYIEPIDFNNSELTENIVLSDIVGLNNDAIARAKHINFLAKKINSIITWVTDKYWSKIEFFTGVIPDLWLNNFLRVDTKISVGDINNPNIFAEGDDTKLGKTGGITKINGNQIFVENKIEKVLVTDVNSEILNDYFVETDLPISNTGVGGQTDIEIADDFWIKEPVGNTITPWQPFLNIPSNIYGFLTGRHFEHLVRHLKAIRSLIFDRPTYQEVNDMIGLNMPVGSIILWDMKLNHLFNPNQLNGGIPKCFVVCDGRMIPGTNIHTNNMIDKFVKGSLTPGIIGGNINHQYKLIGTDMFPHSHTIDPHTHEFTEIDPLNGAPVTFGWDNGLGHTWNLLLRSSAPNNSQTTNVTPATGTQTSFSIEPRSITAIYIMKFWNGSGIFPVTVMPPFANISIININNVLSCSVVFSLTDSTVTNINVEGSLDNGVTWNTLKISLVNISPITFTLPNNGDWEFRLKAINGDSSFTQGEYSNTIIQQVYAPFANINSISNIGLSAKLAYTKTDITVTSFNVIVTDLSTGTSQNYVPSEVTNYVIGVELPALGDYSFKIEALNGNPIITGNPTDNFSNTMNYSINSLFITPSEFVTIDNIYGLQDVNALIVDFTSTTNIGNTTLIDIQYKNSSNLWVTFKSSQVYSEYFQLTKSGIASITNQYNNKLFRFKALNGTLINTYSNEFLLSF